MDKKLKLPVMECLEALKAGFASVAQPVRPDTEEPILRSMDETMAGTNAVWVKRQTEHGKPALELFRKRTEILRAE